MGFQRKGGGKWVGSGRGRGQGDGVKKNWSGGGRGTPNDSLSGKDRIRKTGRSKVWRTAEDALEAKFGFDVFAEGEPRLGWLLNMAASSMQDSEDDSKTFSCVNLYFMCQDGSTFKSQVKFQPYFYLGTKENTELEVDAYLRRRYEGQIASIQIVEKEDLDMKNHLSGTRHTFLKVSFNNVQELMSVKSELLPIVERNQAKVEAAQAYNTLFQGMRGGLQETSNVQDFVDYMLEVREFDVPYHVRFAIDKDVRCGLWYTVTVESNKVKLEKRADLLQRAEARICAFDIETTKLPLKFPDASYDSVMMISYMIDGQGYLIVNRECVGEDIQDLEYTPKPEYEGFFQVTNAPNEKAVLETWFNHMRDVKPGIYVTYNGDFFDWPFLEQRSKHHGMSMYEEIGFRCDAVQGECLSKFACHLDCFAWVKRDSYLPQGSQGLKAVTKAKLGYDPLEVNPEDMVRFAMEKPQVMSSYSVSDAVSTYYLYMTYVHPFIFSLATILPMPPDEVLRKGSGTLCEMLLMVEAFKGNIICPNKHKSEEEKVYNGRILDSETYIGGHVECLESGVFRSDLPTKFRLVPGAYQRLIDKLDRDLKYAIEVEGKMDLDSVTNYDEVKHNISTQLEALRDAPNREETPLIYHLDVAAMYPNIILTNRLQPPSIVTDDVCAACDFNRPDKTCLRQLEWVWRGETFSASRSEYNHLKNQIESEQFPPTSEGGDMRYFRDLPKDEQQSKLKDRLKKYCQKVYKRVLDKPISDVRTAGICMRENPFYVDTVRSFRDRRYEYKGLNKVWKGKLGEAKASGNPIKIQEAQDMVVVYDSLQLAHKCILNSFYGYVMRKGARWYSMEMAGVVTYTGAKIIQNAHKLVEQIGKPLELDTDGIWCCLPGSFPENFVFKTSDPKKKLPISYPCVMLNVDVAVNNTNDQYQTMVDPVSRTYATSSECSIEFEVDGPYKAMILPASKEEGILIKKRYAVFNDDGTLAELKGFEIKRRGELKLIKVFQAEVFENFLQGDTLEECYAAVAEIANRWLDMLENQGLDLADSELLDYISESSTMSKSLEEYGDRKSCAMTTAKRLADFLGDAMVKDKGLSCRYIVAKDPPGAPVSERAIPVAIFETEPAIMKAYLKKWCKSSSDVVFRSIVDWAYYRQRLSSAIQKIITIPAAMQKVSNPVPRVTHPEWLWKKVREKDDKYRQKSLTDMFQKKPAALPDGIEDLEDMCKTSEKHRPTLSAPSHKKGDLIDEIPLQEGECIGQEDIPPIEKSLNEDPENEARSKTPDKEVDYEAWVEYKKLKRKETREQRKRQREVIDPTGDDAVVALPRNVSRKDGKGKRQAGVGAMFRSQQAALTRSHWQLLQLVPTQSPGFFRAWILVAGEMYKLQIQVPRVFYINTRAPPDTESGKRVNRVLPHMKPCFNLLEVVCDEAQFKDARKFLSAHLADPDVEGVYETKISPLQQAILRLGCVCTVDAKASKRNANATWSVDELHMKTTAESAYLKVALNSFFIYQSCMNTRGLYTLYTPAAEKILVVVVNPRNNKEVSSVQLEKQFRDAASNSGLSNLEVSTWTVKVEYLSSHQDAGRLLNRSLVEFRDQHPGPTVALTQCPNTEDLMAIIPLLNEFPCVQIPCNVRDSQYQALGWQPIAGRVAMHRCVASSVWLQERISLARYAHVPLGNVDSDWLLFTADTFYSRALRENQQVLWSSDDGVPDLGGAITDDSTSLEDEVQQPAVSFPGAYRNVTIEFKIYHLAVNALLKSSQISEFEGGTVDGDGSAAFNDGSNTWNEEIFCSPAFRVLKQLVGGWLADAISTGNNYSDALLQHVYRWICSPQSKLHDPALQRVLHKVMQKVFALLLMELRKLGATIVFADFNKIIIATNKSNITMAQGYCEYLLKTVKARELFEWIDLRPKQYWHSLLFMDQHNYGGIKANTATQSFEHQEDQNGTLPEEIVSYWNIAEYLPKVTQDYFVVIVSEYIYIPWKHAMDEAARRRAGPVSSTPSITVAAAADMEAGEILFLKEKVQSHFTEKLLKTVRDVQRHMNTKKYEDDEELQSAREFPKLAGSHLEMTDAALEFIKHVCAVFMLDQRVQHEVLVLRKNLLKLARVREFSQEATFRDPCLSFILPNVICSYCNDCRDMDLCRDAALIERDWRCVMPLCGQPYNREWVENALLQIVRKRERLYHLQDLLCVKCRQVKASHLAEQCTCAGNFRCRESPKDFLQRMRVFHNIAVYHGFDLLQECVSWILQTAAIPED
ncbi:DNA polymerase epsilon subunit 1 [Marchantia polymorpha subsp. ruderalis]|uniref:DNA polymerase epsilon catalytic subunit n=2 Tax=Marchantia polymorpha TaxID=3197 RepID=A0AAF6AYL3_MARPO|nr:hypothetical protein MARPO_0006s0290 [Marchantia polymorpha]BBN04847.1 hypothetical protein Mp_3g08150 [Marchantia polymorpha subsp. ruderalis]|eukprot:PTQ48299.1 hypothetical protein MARPO_0006s0290 [Marchantia polymorpha]